MKRKRFENLMISQHKSQARDIRQAVRTIIELRHYSEGNKGILMVYNEKAECFTEATLYPYGEMYARIQRGQGAIGKES